MLSFIKAVLYAYGSLFYSTNILFGFLLFIASFFNPFSGFCGLLSLILAMIIVRLLKLASVFMPEESLVYNSLLAGIGLGAIFAPSFPVLMAVAIISMLTLLITVFCWHVLVKYSLPVLSLPFVITFLCIMPALESMKTVHYSSFEIYYLNFLYSVGGIDLLNLYNYLNNDFLPPLWVSFLKTLSVIFFQSNVMVGSVIAVGIFIHSRITFLYALMGFSLAYWFYGLMDMDLQDLLSFHTGLNYIFVSIAVGSHYLIPSFSSAITAGLGVFSTIFLKQGMQRLLMHAHISVYSIPFVIVTYLFLWVLRQRPYNHSPQLTTWQYFKPEKNFYKQANRDTRLKYINYIPFELPFYGEWIVSQGYNGKHTHLGEWGQALDFVIVDDEGKQYSDDPLEKEDYYCYNKPLIAPADGWIIDITDITEDNDINEVNTNENWGNTIVIRHAEGLYSQLSHLRKNSIKVKINDFVRKGDILATCGNSGRSPIPHLHFQFHTIPYIGAKTLAYPLGYYISLEGAEKKLHNFTIPKEGEKVQSIQHTGLLMNAFYIYPLKKLAYKVVHGKKERNEYWECFTNSYNISYLYCHTTNSYAYFINDGTMFYFTDFEGSKKSLLYYFYLSCYKVMQGFYREIEIKDTFPLDLFINPYFGFLNDWIAPFFNPTKATFQLNYVSIDDIYNAREVQLESEVRIKVFGQTLKKIKFNIKLKNDAIASFKIQDGKKNIEAFIMENDTTKF